MKFPRIALFGLFVPLLLAGCGSKIQSDLELQNAKFGTNENGKAIFSGSVKNTGNRTYKSVFIVVDGYEKDNRELQVSTSADLFGGRVLGPGESTSFSKEFEDGGSKPDRYELIRLYGTQ